MSAPTRLLDSNRNPAARALLEIARSDRSAPGSARRTAKALGLSAGALASVSAASGVASATSGAASTVAAAHVAPSLFATAAQWLALGLLGGVTVVGGASFVTSSAPPVARVALARSAHVALTSSERVAPEPMPPAVVNVPSEAKSPSARVASVTSSAGVLGRTVSALPGSSEAASGRLAREVALIDDARRALMAGNAQHSLAVLDAYAELDTTGTLNREARVLRIDALLAAGQRTLAVPLAVSYLQEYPADPQTQKLRAVLRSASAPAR